MKIISGGQTGVDFAGIISARVNGLPTGGTMPKGFRTDEGPQPSYADAFGMVEHPSPKYPPRTRANVKDADATIILGNFHSPGCRLTIRYCEELKRPYLVIPRETDYKESIQIVTEWLGQIMPNTLNVAGNRSRNDPGIYTWAYDILREAFANHKKKINIF